jgi:hypothetical protein
MKFFHHFSNHRRNINSIWEIKDDEGNLVSTFQEKAEVGARFFENIFTSPVGCPILETLEVVTKVSNDNK